MTSRIEVLKDHPIVDENYKPSLSLGYQDYFSRAMLFAQSNYQENLVKISNIHWGKITPTFFYQEYAWSVCSLGIGPKLAIKFFPQFLNEIGTLYYQGVRSPRDKNFPRREETIAKSLSIVQDEEKCQALWEGANIIVQGTTLYGWDRYRLNFLSTTKKLQVFPMIGPATAQQLAKNIGLHKDMFAGDPHLTRMASRWGFQSPEALCTCIAKHVVLQPRVIGQILWYAGAHFGVDETAL